jgi:hypothetical protein
MSLIKEADVYYYKVDCWVPPRSGFDLIQKNQARDFIFSIADRMSERNGKRIKQYLNRFEEESKGFVLKTFTLESDKFVTDPEKEFLGEINKKYPEAKIAHWKVIDAPIIKRRIRTNIPSSVRKGE